MNCPDCGARNPADAKFCGDCGHSIAIAPPPEPQPQPPVDPVGFGWDAVFKWIGIGVVGLFVLGLLAGF
jgi:hypothetical protein